MSVLLVGSGGYLGKALGARLAGSDVDVVKASSRHPGGLDPATGRPSDDFRIAPDVDAVVFLAQSPHYHRLPECVGHVVSVNVCAALEVAECARQAGVRRFVYLSSGAVYQPCLAPVDECSPVRRDALYPLTKLQAEEGLRNFSAYMDIHLIRLFALYGPEQNGKMVPNLIEAIAGGREVSLEPRSGGSGRIEDGGLRLSLCYIDDAVRILACIARRGGPTLLNVAGPEALSIREIASAIGERLGVIPRFRIADTCREGDLVADISRLRVACDPSFTSFTEGLKRTLDTGQFQPPPGL